MQLYYEEIDGSNSDIPTEWVTEAVWGSPDGVLYQHNSFEWNPRSRVLVARSDHQIVGMHVWIPYTWGFLRHMIIVPPEFQGRGIAKALIKASRKHFEQQLRPGQCIAGIVDASHSKSVRLGEEAGYDRLGAFDLLTFTRRFPSRNPNVRLATDDEISNFIPTHLSNLGRSWNDFNEQATNENTWVYENKAGEPVAGATTVAHHLTMRSFGLGSADKFLLPAIPLLIRGARPNNYNPVSLHYCWGEGEYLSPLWEAILSELGIGVALVSFDPEDPFYEEVKKHVDMGVMGRAIGIVQWIVTGAGTLNQPLTWPAENR